MALAWLTHIGGWRILTLRRHAHVRPVPGPREAITKMRLACVTFTKFFYRPWCSGLTITVILLHKYT